MIRVVQTGKNPTMRHLNRVHRISVAWLHEQLGNPGGNIACTKSNLFYEKSDEMAADIYTKAFTDPNKWTAVMRLINHWDQYVADVTAAFNAASQKKKGSAGATVSGASATSSVKKEGGPPPLTAMLGHPV